MERMSAILIGLILIASIICGILLIICSILVCKYWYKYQTESRSQRSRNESLIKSDKADRDFISNIKEELIIEDNSGSKDVTLRPNSEDNHLNINSEINRRHSDNSPYREDIIGRGMPSRSISQFGSNTNKGFDFDNYTRKNSFHLRPFELSYSTNQKMSHSMELMSLVKSPLYEKTEERKAHSFDSNIIRNNSKSLTVLNVVKKRKDISNSLISFLHQFSTARPKHHESQNKVPSDPSNKTKEESPQPYQEMDLSRTCPFQKHKFDLEAMKTESSLDSKMCLSSFESSEINEAFLAVSREMHSSCDSELCFNSAAIKRKQFIREKRCPRSAEATKQSNPYYKQSCSANQSFDRDYSVDERSSMIFQAFVRNDPNLDQTVIDENVRRRIRNERAHSQHSGQHRRRSRPRVSDAMKSASFTDGERVYPVNILVSSDPATTSDSSNRAPSPMPVIVLTGDCQE